VKAWVDIGGVDRSGPEAFKIESMKRLLKIYEE